jgi:hypothetical protein
MQKAQRTSPWLKTVPFYGSLLVVLSLLIFTNTILYYGPLRTQLLGENAIGFTRAPKDGPISVARNPKNYRRMINPAKLRPGTALFGASIDWIKGDLPETFSKRFGHNLGIVQYFLEISTEVLLIKELKFIIDSVARVDGTVLSLTIQPVIALDAIPDAAHQQLAKLCKYVNDLGVPVIVRWAHEMNGSWFGFGQKPSMYKAAFKKAAMAIHGMTNLTWMMWAPNSPAGYPWTELANIPVAYRAEMDTNKDGVINELDDPYTPYYPGDEHVDWIGYSVFHFGNSSLTGNGMPTQGEFINFMEFSPTTPAAIALKLSWNLYRDFSQLKNKPFGLMETGAAYYPKTKLAGDATELEVKQAWWKQVFTPATLDKYPLMKILMWFDVAKDEIERAATVYRDFQMTWKSDIAHAFLNDLPKDRIFFADSKDSDFPIIK